MNKEKSFKDYELKFGLEIEASHEEVEFVNEHQQSYHEGDLCTEFFKIESDSSLNSGKKFYCTNEFITRPFRMSETKAMLHDLRHKVFEEAGEEFPLSFNSSCGCHLNFSLVNKRTGKKVNMVNFKMIEKIRTETTKVFCKSYKNQYSRGYAKTIKKEEFIRCFNERSSEFNFRGNNVVEFRSFNLSGVKTWDAMEKRITQALNIVKKTVQREINKKQPFQQKIVVNVARGE